MRFLLRMYAAPVDMALCGVDAASGTAASGLWLAVVEASFDDQVAQRGDVGLLDGGDRRYEVGNVRGRSIVLPLLTDRQWVVVRPILGLAESGQPACRRLTYMPVASISLLCSSETASVTRSSRNEVRGDREPAEASDPKARVGGKRPLDVDMVL